MDLNELTHSINTKTVISYKDRQKSIRWLAHQNDQIILDVFKLKKNHFYRLKNVETSQDIVLLDVIAFYLAIKEIVQQSVSINRKNRSKNFGFMRKISQTRAKQLRKPRLSKKREKLLNMQGIILNLIENEGYSLRNVSNYLLTYHRFSVSHTEIGKFYHSLKGAENVE
ncbi:hypothetical protein E0765_08540 [Sulfuricurvum sp. IAE1]|uniref:hypothetical protein n=1 Tax=Sulfuricurvum sp. IAE1 TaxID=2546102 RepID=UPI0010475ED4|nr:hypothetical protein [Sulfuricurvum sp. IAE1]TDA63241.1 hypothetical protein E0765_08540 [Sulfuricurvum sp. IAE1]